VEVRDGATREWTIDPARLGLLASSADELAGGDPSDNARVIVAVLGGHGSRGATAAVLLNAAAAIYLSGLAPDFEGGVELARAALAGGKGMRALELLRGVYAAR
jgi:anthranilate phosphoribosyltransferase